MLKLNTILYQIQVEVIDGTDATLIPELEKFLNAIAEAHPKIKGVSMKSFPSYKAPYIKPETETENGIL